MTTSFKSLRLAGAAALLVAVGATAFAQASAPANVLSIADIEARMTAQGISIREIELRDLVAEVEGRDANGRKIELLVDRRSGEILSKKLDK